MSVFNIFLSFVNNAQALVKAVLLMLKETYNLRDAPLLRALSKRHAPLKLPPF